MNLNTITEVKRPVSLDDVGPWRSNYAWLAGGTWLYSEPQIATDTLIDLDALGWAPLTATAEGLEIAATCRVADLHAAAHELDPALPAAGLKLHLPGLNHRTGLITGRPLRMHP